MLPLIRVATLADIPSVAEVHVASWRSTYRGIVPDEIIEYRTVARRREQWGSALERNAERGAVMLVAETEREGILGFASAGPEREGDPTYDGELYAIYLLASAQRRGIGRALTQAAAAWLLERGHGAMLVWVLRDNPACGFYERLGGVYLREKPITLGPVTMPEIAYGWPDLAALANPADGEQGHSPGPSPGQ